MSNPSYSKKSFHKENLTSNTAILPVIKSESPMTMGLVAAQAASVTGPNGGAKNMTEVKSLADSSDNVAMTETQTSGTALLNGLKHAQLSPTNDGNDSEESDTIAVKPAKKRVRTTAESLLAPRAAVNTPAPLTTGSFTNFTATIYIIQLGQEGKGAQFHAHESVLSRSPTLRDAIEKAKGNKRIRKQNVLSLMPHDPIAFEQMLQYLYTDKFNLRTNTVTTPLSRLQEIFELMSLAKHYGLPGLQKLLVKIYSSSKMSTRLTTSTFFDWSEDMYHEELDHERGPFKMYFARVAPGMLKGLAPGEVPEVLRMVKQGGPFAVELFKACHQALFLAAGGPKVKTEEGTTSAAGPSTGDNAQTGDGAGLFLPQR